MTTLVEKCIDFMVPVHNRAEFTKECLTTLFQNTNWKYVRKLHLYDVDSKDGAGQVIRDMIPQFQSKVDTQVIGLGKITCTAVQNYHVQNSIAPIIAKIDNDVLVPPGWLDTALSVLARNSHIHILGLEAMMPIPTRNMNPDEYGIHEQPVLDGLFLARRTAFQTLPFIYGRVEDYWDWQSAHPEVKKAWINPCIPMILMDRLPFEPWISLSRMYMTKGWQRYAEPYPRGHPLWTWRWPTIKGNDQSQLPIPVTNGLRVDLGTSDHPPEGFDVYVDIAPHPILPASKVRVADLNKDWPFADGEVAHFRAHDIIEHLPDKIHTMNEMFRCLTNGGTAEIFVPLFDGAGAVCDPQHISFWNRMSFDYFTKGSPAHNRFAGAYGIKAAFEVLQEERKSFNQFYLSGEEVVKHLMITLCARKKVERRWTVVIPSNSTDRLRRSVRSVLATHPDMDPSWIVVVDDGARKGWTAEDPPVTWVTGQTPFIYARNVNIGIRAAYQAGDIFLMGDDCELATPYLISTLRDVAKKDPTIGIISAGITGIVGNPQQTYSVGGAMVESSPVGLAFVSVYLTKGLLSSVGELDERFVGYGCEDTDYCKRTTQAGFRLLIHQGTEVIHNAPGMPSAWRTKPDIESKHAHNRKLYEEKWAGKA